MELLVAFGTDDGKSLKADDHVGMSKYFDVYRISQNKEEFVERRENVKVEADESMKHGEILKKFVCAIARTDTINSAIKLVHDNMDRIIEEKNKGEERKHLVLKAIEK